MLKGKYNESCDMWSMGVILFVMVFAFPPFCAKDNKGKTGHKKIYKKIKRGFEPKVRIGYGAWFPKDIPVSKEYKDLVARLMRKDVVSRLTAEEALGHPWITRNSELNIEPLPIIRSLRIFRRSCALKRDVLLILRGCNFLSEDQELAVRNTFSRIDQDGDGIITSEELYHVIRKLDPEITREEVKEIVLAADFDGVGGLTVDDFLSVRVNRKVTQKEERLRRLFSSLDLDKSGTLSYSDICAALESIYEKQLSEQDAKKLIADFSTTDKGEVNYEDFLAMFSQRDTSLA